MLTLPLSGLLSLAGVFGHYLHRLLRGLARTSRVDALALQDDCPGGFPDEHPDEEGDSSSDGLEYRWYRADPVGSGPSSLCCACRWFGLLERSGRRQGNPRHHLRGSRRQGHLRCGRRDSLGPLCPLWCCYLKLRSTVQGVGDSLFFTRVVEMLGYEKQGA